MAAQRWVNDGGTARRIRERWVNDNGVARKIKERWVNDNGVARRVYASEVTHEFIIIAGNAAQFTGYHASGIGNIIPDGPQVGPWTVGICMDDSFQFQFEFTVASSGDTAPDTFKSLTINGITLLFEHASWADNGTQGTYTWPMVGLLNGGVYPVQVVMPA